MNRFKTLIVRFSIAIFILCGFVSLYSQDIKEKRLWLVELNGALTSQSSFSAYRLCRSDGWSGIYFSVSVQIFRWSCCKQTI